MSLNPIDPADPTELPLALRVSDVITTDPKTGAHGLWTFDDIAQVGDQVCVGCHDRDGATVVFVMAPSQPLHIKPRGDARILGGAA